MLITRRELLAGLTAASVTSAVTDLGFAQSDVSGLRIDAARLQQSLEGLSVYGRPAGGTFADGVSRVAYSDADIAGRTYAMKLMRAAGPSRELMPPETSWAGAKAATARSSRFSSARISIQS